ncbi:T9SS type A sorting domain-containing protein [Winogradskyella sp. 3972H.M.0a.05]|uniref:T9SS type A sorting domain-containing protein n=1 Tax=Winogradskyella sp. 3972H.M.0a.05 TaxID=2950277 RepID=UPI003396DF10
MKHFIITLSLLIASLQLNGQSISKQVIGSSGKAITNGTYTINYTVGETIVGKIENGQTIYQGFWAELNSDETLSVQTLVEQTESISVFPNPTVNLLQVKFKLQEASNYQVQLYDVNGKQIFNLKPVSQGDITRMNISHLSSGMYVLVIADKTSNYNKSFKIIKR